ncbi:MAG: hypothetical protein U0998_01750 [Moraxellaceae bacterium]|nr:hypothetical protein [Moraxellaceae bacterium]MDZ4297652.1 hypothetical protein [Moraxellaceae bacterium]MDZ4385925.1 hypothetical protein [Moraxellaceae bacterium]
MNSPKAIALSLVGFGLLWAAINTLYWLMPKPTDSIVTEPEQAIDQDTAEEAENADTDQDTPIVYSQWVPDLTQSIEQLEEWIATDLSQQELNFSMANLNTVYDAKLYIKFHELLKIADIDDHSDLINQQASWIEARKTLTIKAFNDYGGGSLASYHAGEIFLQLTRQRLDELNRQQTRLLTP